MFNNISFNKVFELNANVTCQCHNDNTNMLVLSMCDAYHAHHHVTMQTFGNYWSIDNKVQLRLMGIPLALHVFNHKATYSDVELSPDGGTGWKMKRLPEKIPFLLTGPWLRLHLRWKETFRHGLPQFSTSEGDVYTAQMGFRKEGCCVKYVYFPTTSFTKKENDFD